MEIVCLGTGDAFNSGGRRQPSFLLKTGADQVLIDCGANTLLGLKSNKVDINEISAIFLTHFHGDHIGGLPHVIVDGAFKSKRNSSLTIIGPEGVEQRVQSLVYAMYPSVKITDLPFKLDFQETEPHKMLRWSGLNYQYYPVQHSPDSHPHGIQFRYNGKILAYSGDTEWCDGLVEMAENANCLIVDCTFHQEPAVNHLSHEMLWNNKEKLRAQKIYLTHCGSEVLRNSEQVRFEILVDDQIFSL